ncbi:meiotic recombination protein REC114-like [Styela clava]
MNESVTGNLNRTWGLSKYARLLPKAVGTGDAMCAKSGEWKTSEDSLTSPLSIVITVTGHLTILSGTTVLEGYFLVDAHKWLKGFCKNNCIVIAYKTCDVSRIFRLQFRDCDTPGSTSDKLCKECASVMGKYFTVKVIENTTNENALTQAITMPALPTVSNICSTILSDTSMPLLYQHCNYDVTNSAEGMAEFVTTCLTDPNFPAFVGHVEKVINGIKNK